MSSGLTKGDIDAPAPPYCVTEIELVIGSLTREALMYWVPFVTIVDDAATALVFAPVGVKGSATDTELAVAARSRGYKVERTKKSVQVDLRGMWDAIRLELAIDPYLAVRGSFADIAPSRVELVEATPSSFDHPTLLISEDVATVPCGSRNLPLRVDGIAQGSIATEVRCKLEFRTDKIKWLDFYPASFGRTDVAMTKGRVSTALEPVGLTLQFRLLELHADAASPGR